MRETATNCTKNIAAGMIRVEFVCLTHKYESRWNECYIQHNKDLWT